MTVHWLNDCPSAPQGNECLITHFIASLGAQKQTDIAYCTSMLWSIDSCQNRISTDQYHLTILQAQVSTHQGRVFFYQFLKDRRLKFNFLKFIWNMLCLCAVLLKFWFQTDLGPDSASYYRQGRDFGFCHHGHKLVKIYLQFLCSDWSKFDRWVHMENLHSILKLDNFGSWSWQSFVSTCDLFKCLFPLDVQNEIQLP